MVKPKRCWVALAAVEAVWQQLQRVAQVVCQGFLACRLHDLYADILISSLVSVDPMSLVWLLRGWASGPTLVYWVLVHCKVQLPGVLNGRTLIVSRVSTTPSLGSFGHVVDAATMA
jgi:hypothetical protein